MCMVCRVEELLARRRAVQARYDAGEKPSFLPDTSFVRESEWTVSTNDVLDCSSAFFGSMHCSTLLWSASCQLYTFTWSKSLFLHAFGFHYFK